MSPPEESPGTPGRPAPRRMSPPPSLAARSTVTATGSGRWRIEGNHLLVESGAVLPEVCIYGSPEGEPGQKIAMILPCLLPGKETPEDVRVTAYQSSKRAQKLKVLRRVLQFTVPFVVAYLLWIFLKPSPRWVIGSAVGVFFALSAWEQGRGLDVVPTAEKGWYVVTGVHPRAIARLRNLMPEAQQATSSGI